MNSIPLILLSAPTVTLLATVRYNTLTLPVARALFIVTVASYLAWIGQIGVQLVLPAHTRRPAYGWELRPAGVGLTTSGKPSNICPVTAVTKLPSTSDNGMLCIGN